MRTSSRDDRARRDATLKLPPAAVTFCGRLPTSPASSQHACKDVGLHYRVYRLNPAGVIVSGEWIEADSEPQARSRAATFCDADTPMVELWQGTHKLAVLPCHDEPSA